MSGMRSNVQEFMVRIGNGETSEWSDLERKLYRQIHGYDLKKIKLERVVGFKMVNVKVRKIDDLLLPYNSLPGGEPPLTEISTSTKG